MNRLVGIIIGGFIGWVIGYFIFVSECTNRTQELRDDNPFKDGIKNLAEVVCTKAATTAKETIILTVLGVFVGLFLVYIWEWKARHRKAGANRLVGK